MLNIIHDAYYKQSFSEHLYAPLAAEVVTSLCKFSERGLLASRVRTFLDSCSNLELLCRKPVPVFPVNCLKATEQDRGGSMSSWGQEENIVQNSWCHRWWPPWRAVDGHVGPEVKLELRECPDPMTCPLIWSPKEVGVQNQRESKLRLCRSSIQQREPTLAFIIESFHTRVQLPGAGMPNENKGALWGPDRSLHLCWGWKEARSLKVVAT